jgi:transposase-like protein
MSIPYLWLDVLVGKVRLGSRPLSGAVLVAIGVAENCARAVNDVTVAAGEMAPCWKSVLPSLVGAGLGWRLCSSRWNLPGSTPERL